MPKKSYALEPGGVKRVVVSWKSFWKDFMIEIDGEVVGKVPNQKELQTGQRFELPNGSILDVKLARTWISAELQILINGKPLPGSGSDPRTRLKQSYGFLFFIGGLNFGLGLIASLFQVEFLLDLGMGFYSIIIGVIYLLLAFFVQRKSKGALIMALSLYGLETILSLATGFVSGVIVRILFIVFMWQGYGAINELRKEEDNSTKGILE